MPPLSQPCTYVSSTMPPPLSQPHVSFSMSSSCQPFTYVSSSISLDMSQPPHFIPPHASPSMSTTFIPTLGMQEIPCNYFVQGNVGAVRGHNPLPQSSGASNRASVASANGDSTGIPNKSNTMKKFL
ncbi:hypothetical protein ACH5RR_032745 [Cinchona calisaya]|uniref:Uncharacterized protein n=1 Tax=Cinchona calisaya TaxID=153742 RepID=A0ABD2YP98_9GENT